jgi:hypothetical protein
MNKKNLLSCLLIAMFISLAGCSDDDNLIYDPNTSINPFTGSIWGYIVSMQTGDWIALEFFNKSFRYNYITWDGATTIKGTYTFANNNLMMTYKDADENIVKWTGKMDGEKLTVIGIMPDQISIIFDKGIIEE